jgi:hypothetical protein
VAAAVTSALVLGWVLWIDALLQPPKVHLEPLPAVAAAREDVVVPIRPGASAPVLQALVLDAVNRDPFRMDRGRPDGRYGTPPPSSAVDQTSAPQSEPPPPVRLIAVAEIASGRNIAALQADGSSARIVHVGDAIAGLQVLSIQRGLVRLQATDSVIVLRMTDSSPPPLEH